MPTKKTNPTNKNKPAAARSAFTDTDGPKAFQHFLPLVDQIPEKETQACRAELPLVRNNVNGSVEKVTAHLDALKVKAPATDIASLLELPALAAALVYAGGRVSTAPSTREIARRLNIIRPMRELGLKQLDVFAGMGLVPVARVRAIHEGTGILDIAQDGVDIVGTFDEFAAAVAGKHPFPKEWIETLRTESNWLVQAIKPGSAPKKQKERDPAALTRDRFWVEVNRRYDALRDAGVAIWGIARVNEFVPPIQSRAGNRPAAAQKPKTPATPAGAVG